jgi:hypothetical protein
MSATRYNQQQQHLSTQLEQQQPDPRLLLGLPGPALRLVLRLTTTPASPGMCRLSCVSKGLRSAVEAAAYMVIVSLCQGDVYRDSSLTDAAQEVEAAARIVSLKLWLGHHLYSVRGLSLALQGAPAAAVVLALAAGPLRPAALAGSSAASAAAAEARADHKPAAAGAAQTAAEGLQLRVQAAANAVSTIQPVMSPLPLRHLHLHQVDLSPAVARCLGTFEQLQVLIVAGSLEVPGTFAALLQAFPRLAQLQRLSLRLYRTPLEVVEDDLLLSLPPSLHSLYLRWLGGPYVSRYSLMHLVNLRSLSLPRTIILSGHHPKVAQRLGLPPDAASDGGGLAPGVSSMVASLMYQVGPRDLTDSWSAYSGLEAVVLRCMSDVNVAQLAGCARLRQLIIEDGLRVGCVNGLSALTQLTRLRVTGRAEGFGRELATLQKLQLLEVYLGSAVALQPAWLSPLSSLEKIAVLIHPIYCFWFEDSLRTLSRLSGVLNQLHSSTSSNSSPRSNAAAESTRSSEGRSVADVARFTRCVQLTVWRQPWEGYFDEERTAMEHSPLQQATADMAAALPWLQVVAAKNIQDCPCWIPYDECLGAEACTG